VSLSSTETGFDEFMRARYPALLRTATLLMGDAGHGEDLLQNALFKTAVRWRRLREPSAAEAYVRVVMARDAGHARRRRWVREHPTSTLPEQLTGDASAAVDLTDALARELTTLPRDQRIVLVLRYYEDLAEREVAALLGCSLGTVKSRASRGIAQLRERGVLTGLGVEPRSGT
jgi:RNA polymerase sigma-70 factor (sigma-E family)